MNVTKVKCNTCGGEIQINSRFANTVTCRYCNSVYLLENEELIKEGTTKPFAPLSILKVGAKGTIKGRTVQILGRIRLEDEEDIWDEWYVLIDGQPHWIEESSDYIFLFEGIRIKTPLKSFHTYQVGNVIEINEESIFITEKGQATLIGIEGEFVGKVKANDDYKYLQGNSEDYIYAIQYYENSIRLVKGIEITYDDIQIA
jgi:hypothetical protein